MKENKTKLAIIISFLALIGTVSAQVRERYTTPTIDSLRRVYEHEFDEDDFDFSSTNVILIPAKDPNKIPFYDPNGNPTVDPNLYYDPNSDTLFVINIDVNGLTLADLTAIRLVFTDSNSTLASVTDLTAWIAGTTDHISFSDDGDGTGTIDLDTNTQILLGSFNGIFLEKLDFTISEAGGTVTGSLEQESGGDLIQKFSDGYTTLDCTPIKTIDLTAYVGTNAVPKEVFIYILQSAKTTIVASNVDWPLDPELEHIKIAHLVLKSAVTTGTDGGALMNQNHNDYAFDATGEGHLQDIEHRLRQEPAAYHSGVALTLKNAGGTELTTGNSSTAVELVTATGHVYQIHQHNFPAFDMYTEATDKVDIVNQPADEGGNYETTVDLVTDITHYVDGTAAGVIIGTNKYFNLVIWGVMNRNGEVSFLMINLPTGQYTKSANAVADVDGTSIYQIPSAFKGTGFLIARLTFRLIGGSQWTYVAQEDLRGKFPDIIAGVGITTTDHALLANLIAPADDHTQYILVDGTRAIAQLKVDDASTYIDKDGSNNMTLTDAVVGTKTLADLEQTTEEIEDIVGGMTDGTETFISVDYQDATGNIDYVVPVKDEDDMTSDSASHLSTQQSVKAYVDIHGGGVSPENVIWRDIRTDFSILRKGTSPPGEENSSIGASGNIVAYNYAFNEAAGDEEVFFHVIMPNDIDDTYNVQFRIGWWPDTNWGSGDYRWVLEYLVRDIDNMYGPDMNREAGTPTVIYIDELPDNSNDLIESPFYDPNTIDANKNQVIFCRLFLDSSESSADDDAHLYYTMMQYASDTPGPTRRERMLFEDGDVMLFEDGSVMVYEDET